MSEIETPSVFSYISDDLVLKIFFKMDDDPRSWSRLACACTRFSSLIRTICWKIKCHQTIPGVVADLLPPNTPITSAVSPPGGWASLYKLAVCCPGVVLSGVLLENSDLGLERDLGPEEKYRDANLFQMGKSKSDSDLSPSCSSTASDGRAKEVNGVECSWSLYDDLYFDTVYNSDIKLDDQSEVCQELTKMDDDNDDAVKVDCDFGSCKKRKACRFLRSHLASGVWNLSREQGNKLLASRFRGDCLYICDWPGCIHSEEKRNYMLFRGVFKNFKQSRVWRTIKDGKRHSISLNCAFCAENQVWDLHSAFCLRPAYGFHDDGDPVVRAYVCENGHVSGAWTDWPLYT